MLLVFFKGICTNCINIRALESDERPKVAAANTTKEGNSIPELLQRAVALILCNVAVQSHASCCLVQALCNLVSAHLHVHCATRECCE